MSRTPTARRPYFIESLETRRLLAFGALDTSFSGDGKATLDFGNGVKVSAKDVAVQFDGKTVVVGRSPTFDFAVARFNGDGPPDTTFGPDHSGKILTQVGDSDKRSFANAVAIPPDGKIIVAGEINATPTSATTAMIGIVGIVRYMPAGSLD